MRNIKNVKMDANGWICSERHQVGDLVDYSRAVMLLAIHTVDEKSKAHGLPGCLSPEGIHAYRSLARTNFNPPKALIEASTKFFMHKMLRERKYFGAVMEGGVSVLDDDNFELGDDDDGPCDCGGECGE